MDKDAVKDFENIEGAINDIKEKEKLLKDSGSIDNLPEIP